MSTLIQLGYACRNLEQAVNYFVEMQGAGPFFGFDVPAGGVTYMFRGAQVEPTRNRVAFGYRGQLQLELFETDNPLFEHVRGESSIHLHHCMQMSRSFDLDRATYVAAGYQIIGTARMPGADIHYIDTMAELGHYTELFDHQRAMAETGGAMFAAFEVMRRSAETWDGADRFRPMPG